PPPAPAAPIAVPVVEAARAARAARPPVQRTHVVAPGDTLYRIAVTNGVGGGWRALHAANAATIGPDPAAIRVGQVLVLP
ncbi:LysM domain-containing protein, partial [Kineococcus glutinatus]|uniref:LysM peptidoglycan-binding domain-containing protein n=1 Tax=Kineococcus glutinatus TaxID=1070872 RepID=UPI0031E70F56